MSNTINHKFSFPLFTVLGIIFIVLKLTDNIDWSWWFVLLPFYIGFAILFGGLILAGLVAMVGLGIAWIISKFS